MKLLDSTVLVDIDRGGDTVREKAERLDADGPHAISTVSVTELFLGLEKKYDREGKDYVAARDRLEKLLSRFRMVPVNRSVAITASHIINELQQNGLPVNDLHDIYIAATGRVMDVTVLTANVDHFDRVTDVMVEDWNAF